MKAELERIWLEEPIAWPCNIAGWHLKRPTTKVIRAGMTNLIGWHRIKKVGTLISLKCRRNKFKNVNPRRKTSRNSKRIFSK